MTFSDPQAVVTTDVIVIGTGFSGLGLAVKLKEQGRDFIILERAAEVGGTWRDNTYPGAACDIQSHLYSYSFRPNPNWSRVYATQPEILQYLQSIAREDGIYPYVRFNSNVTSAVWDEDAEVWNVTTSTGVYQAPALVSAAGHLSDPVYPEISGIEKFTGKLFHSARWDHSVEFTGKLVGVIGTGASAIQIVPEVARTARHLTVFQRSAPYIIPRRDYVYTEAEKGMFGRVPETAQHVRDDLFWGNESRFPQRRRVPAFIEHIESAARNHLSAQISDPQLRAELTPDYEIGCKRILISNDYYPTLCLPHVDIETSGIDHIDATGIVTKDGEHIDLDILIVATGFEASKLPIADVVRGRDNKVLADAWATGGNAFACTTVSGFPNLLMMLGPNTGLGAGSILYMVETQITYICEALDYIASNNAIIEPDMRAQRDYVESIYQRSEGTVWIDGGCSSWYLHPRSQKLTTLWPDFMSQFRRENGAFTISGYLTDHRRTAELDLQGTTA